MSKNQTAKPAAKKKPATKKSTARKHLTARVDKKVFGAFYSHAKVMTATARKAGVLGRKDKAFSVGDVLSELGPRLAQVQGVSHLADYVKKNAPAKPAAAK